MTTNDPPDQRPGQWYPQQAPPVERTGRAVTALVLGIIGLFVWILAPLAIGFGISALRKARGRQVTGKGAAVAGLVLGILGTIVLVAVIAGIAASADGGGGSGTAS